MLRRRMHRELVSCVPLLSFAEDRCMKRREFIALASSVAALGLTIPQSILLRANEVIE